MLLGGDSQNEPSHNSEKPQFRLIITDNTVNVRILRRT